MKRRTFCYGLATAALGAGTKIRAAMIGTAHGHAASKVKCLRALPEYEFVGVCRPDLDEPADNEAFRAVKFLSLDEVLNNVTHRSAGTGGVDTLTNAADRARLVKFIQSIDATSAPIP